MKTVFLLLWFEAPLQSWGSDSKFGRRETLNFPTKSGVLGLICAAMGAIGQQKELLARFASLRQSVISFALTERGEDGELKKKAREPALRDFQMVGSGYDDKDSWETLNIPKTNEGKKPVGAGTKLTYRKYLQDARFAVLVQIPEDLAERIATAIQNPVYDIYLGRKTCVPTDYIYAGIHKTEKDAYDQSINLAQQKGLLPDFKVLEDSEEPGVSITLNDVPLQFGEIKKYRDRKVKIINI